MTANSTLILLSNFPSQPIDEVISNECNDILEEVVPDTDNYYQYHLKWDDDLWVAFLLMQGGDWPK